MENSGYYHLNMTDKNHAVGYSQFTDPPVRADMTIMDYGYAAGGLYSSAEDLFKWDQALYTDKLVKKETLDKIFGKYPNGYGYGWYISDDKDGIVAQHDGVGSGGNSLIVRYTNKKRLIVILTNLDAGLPGPIIPAIENLFAELD
jgi:CubicO group peptidase (beta-lactamase class C family)